MDNSDMDTTKYYKDATTGIIIGKFAFATRDHPGSAGRRSVGTIYYFEGNIIPNQASKYIFRTYSDYYNIQNPPIPYDIEQI